MVGFMVIGNPGGLEAGGLDWIGVIARCVLVGLSDLIGVLTRSTLGEVGGYIYIYTYIYIYIYIYTLYIYIW